ncbi:MAG: DUF2063 domain-containing protein, partial [Gammaproteobacteria bacterium]
QPDKPAEQAACIIVYRDDDDEVQFTEINPVTARLLQQLEQNASASGAEVLQGIAEELGSPDTDQILQSGLEILEGLKQKGIILGTTKN